MRRFNSLDDFLATTPLTVDGVGNDGGEVAYPVKGVEIDATVLFCDISNFSGRTFDLSSTETLAFVNHFFTWISEEALHGRPGIVDKYIGDEVMVVFSTAFGSSDPVLDALSTAVNMIDHDPWAFEPHVGIASGPVTVGHVGTPFKYNTSVFGQCVATAARCAGVKPTDANKYGGYITFPSTEWKGRQLEDAAPPRKYLHPDGTTKTDPNNPWFLSQETTVSFKNMGDFSIRQLIKTSIWLPQTDAVSKARNLVSYLRKNGSYRPL